MPQAILLKDVQDLGPKGALVDVSKGYLRNYLIPRDLAQPATKASIQDAARFAAGVAAAAERAQADAAGIAEQLNKTVLTISQQAGDDGQLFGSVTNADIAEAILAARGVDIDKKKIKLETPIKQVGTHQVEVEVAKGVTATVKTIVSEL
ncbi:MAG TPA: 50S ribosomal protein L9 [Baekduia sp.]|nr:50S ribosomal protein L9 [Baekduia sp.]